MGDTSNLSVFEQVADLIVAGEDARDGVLAWGNECCTANPNAAYGGEDLYASYRKWATSKGAPTCSERTFLVTLGNAQIPKTMRKGRRVWLGLDVRPEWLGDGAIDYSSKSTEWADDLRDKVKDWAKAECYLDTRAESWTDDLYDEFTRWNGGERVGRVGFGKSMNDLFHGKGAHRHERQPRMVGGKTLMRTMWSGLGLRKFAVAMIPAGIPSASDDYDENEMI
jgi:phage/plasmid-associated DNA primase